ncbi:MAG: hypothetical protein K0U74_04585 [Alphaproteobacteria bacterium]|nr:hypothetical protein [Alphaproteobacteria bacterium]
MDRKTGWGIGVWLGGVAVAFAGFSAAHGKDVKRSPPLSKPELRELLTGNSLAGNGRDKTPAEPYDWIAHYGGDGRIVMRLKPEWGGFIYKGRWWMTDDGEFCRFFENKQKKEGCWWMHREGDFLRFVPSSGVAVEGRAVMLPGDAVGEDVPGY